MRNPLCRCERDSFGGKNSAMNVILHEKENQTKKRIFVVDDDEMHLDIVKELVENEGIEVITHHNGFGAVNRILELKPDLVLLDINMPGVSGDKLAAMLRANHEANHVPIVFYSSNDECSLREIVSACKVQGYICKGDIANLRQNINLYLCCA